MKVVYSLMIAIISMVATPTLFAEDCLLCGSGSKNGCQQCRGDRKSCEAKGCKISGTASCSSAANVKICQTEKPMVDLTYFSPKSNTETLQVR